MKQEIKNWAREIGFSLVGITSAELVSELAHLEDAIDSGRTATMRWLARNPRRRCAPEALLPGAKSVICCGLAYGNDGIDSTLSLQRLPSLCSLPHQGGGGKRSGVRARFARGADYHYVVKEKLGTLWSKIVELNPSARSKLCVDTSPILEKALAQRAGLGWIGRHTILVNEELGSWFVLGEIITDIEIDPDRPSPDRCGDCRACIDACPTDALLDSRVLDARRCISYLTIEAPRVSSEPAHHPLSSRRSLDSARDDNHGGSRVQDQNLPALHSSPFTIHGFTYGCDACQEACPYNKR